jgi:hypothetical protein
MFRRQWIWFGKLISDEGFKLWYGHKSIYYEDARGRYCFGFEDGLLFPEPFRVKGAPKNLTSPEVKEIVERVIRGIKSEGYEIEVFNHCPSNHS